VELQGALVMPEGELRIEDELLMAHVPRGR
jgi:hypothetical protein